MKIKYSVIIPCYNESSNLVNLLKSLECLVVRDDTEIILVENGSLDDSRKILEKLVQPQNTKIKVVYVDKNKGYGYGILQGIMVATGGYVGWIHADLQVNPTYLLEVFKVIETNGRRPVFVKGKRRNRHFVEYIFSYGMSIFETILFKKVMYEVMAMPCMIPRKLLIYYIKRIPYDFSIDVFVYAIAIKHHVKTIHIPVDMKDRRDGISTWNTGFLSRIKQSHKMIRGSIKVKRLLNVNMRSK